MKKQILMLTFVGLMAGSSVKADALSELTTEAIGFAKDNPTAAVVLAGTAAIAGSSLADTIVKPVTGLAQCAWNIFSEKTRANFRVGAMCLVASKLGVTDIVTKQLPEIAKEYPTATAAVIAGTIVAGSTIADKLVEPITGAAQGTWNWLSDKTRSNIRVGAMSMVAFGLLNQNILAPAGA